MYRQKPRGGNARSEQSFETKSLILSLSFVSLFFQVQE